jgi:hypothetical protein
MFKVFVLNFEFFVAGQSSQPLDTKRHLISIFFGGRLYMWCAGRPLFGQSGLQTITGNHTVYFMFRGRFLVHKRRVQNSEEGLRSNLNRCFQKIKMRRSIGSLSVTFLKLLLKGKDQIKNLKTYNTG